MIVTVMGVLVFVAKLAAAAVAGYVAGWLISKAVEFTIGFLWKAVKRIFEKNPDAKGAVAVGVKEAQEKIKGAINALAETAKARGNVFSAEELQQDAELKEGVKMLDNIQKEGISHLIAPIMQDGQLGEIEAYQDKASVSDPKVGKYLKEGTVVISR